MEVYSSAGIASIFKVTLLVILGDCLDGLSGGVGGVM